MRLTCLRCCSDVLADALMRLNHRRFEKNALPWYPKEIDPFYPTGTPRWIDVESSWILCEYVEEQISTNFHVVSIYFFDVVSLIEKSASFPGTFFDIISMVKKYALFPQTGSDLILMVEKSTLFSHTFFDVISMVKQSTLFPCAFFDIMSFIEICSLSTYFFWCNFDGLIIHFLCTYFFRQNFDEFDAGFARNGDRSRMRASAHTYNYFRGAVMAYLDYKNRSPRSHL